MGSGHAGGSTPIAISVRCGVEYFAAATRNSLARSGFAVERDGGTRLVLDAPSGYALDVLEPESEPGRPLLVATWNPCPQHLEDLWELGPAALLAGEHQDRNPAGHLAEALEALGRGERVRRTPWERSPLTHAERRMLQHSVRGASNKEVARDLGIHEQTVSNTLSRVYDKLGLDGREHAWLYYWGVWGGAR